MRSTARHRRRRGPGLDTALGKLWMEALSLVKVLMVTTFLWNGNLTFLKEKTTFALCEQAQVEAARFNNRYLGLYEENIRRRGNIEVTCHWLKKSKEA